MNKGKYISYSTLLAAKQGDTEAIESIIEHFRGYITSRSLRTAYRPDGSSYQYVDSDVRHYMETELIEAIFRFEIR